MPTTFLLVRHGSTPTTNKVLPGRRAGLFLSDKGREEVQLTAERIAKDYPAALVYTSPLERTVETAEIIARELKGKSPTKSPIKNPIKNKGLIECDFGSWTGRSLASLRKLSAWKQVQKTPSGFRFPKGESFLDLQTRMVETLTTLAQKHPAKTIVAVSHADPIKAALGYFLGVPLDLFQRIHISPASISSVILSKEPPVVLAVNITERAKKQK